MGAASSGDKPAVRSRLPGRGSAPGSALSPPLGLEAGPRGEQLPWAGPRPGPAPTYVTAPRPRPRPARVPPPPLAGAAGERGVARWWRGAASLRLRTVGYAGAARGTWAAAAGRGCLRVGLGLRGTLGPSRLPPGPGVAAWAPGLGAGREAARAGGSRIRTRPALRALSAGCGRHPTPFPRFPLRTLHPGGAQCLCVWRRAGGWGSATCHRDPSLPSLPGAWGPQGGRRDARGARGS